MQTENIRKEGFIETNEVKLHWLDWGGKGQSLVLLSGLGDTPLLFDSLARALSGNFHVIGYSRRNHGQSKAADGKVDNRALVADLKLFLDSLSIDKASLLGWSLAGNEITEFAALYPERVRKLIYFESGYDLSDGGFASLLSNIPKPFLPDASIRNSLNDYRQWYHRFWFGDMEWNQAMEANLIASVRFHDDGRIRTIPDDEVFKIMLKEGMNYRRRYAAVSAPSLVIYAKPFFHPPDDSPGILRLYDSMETSIVSPWRSRNRRRIEEELRKPLIVEAPRGTHTSVLFLSHDFLVETISHFLADEN